MATGARTLAAAARVGYSPERPGVKQVASLSCEPGLTCRVTPRPAVMMRVSIPDVSNAIMQEQLHHHPIYERLIAPAEPFARHALLHAMELQLSRVPQRRPGLHARVRSFVDRGVPFFAPADVQYVEWATRAAALWDELHGLAGKASEPAPV